MGATAPEPFSGSSSDAAPRLEYDDNGRALRPRIPGLQNACDATDLDRRSATAWARAWCDLPDANADIVNDVLEKLIKGGAAPRKDTPENRLAQMAMRALYLAAEENRAAKVVRALPYLQLRTDVQDDPCVCSQALANRYISVSDFPRIPLPGCTSDRCKCWAKSVTKREVEGMTAAQ